METGPNTFGRTTTETPTRSGRVREANKKKLVKRKSAGVKSLTITKQGIGRIVFSGAIDPRHKAVDLRHICLEAGSGGSGMPYVSVYEEMDKGTQQCQTGPPLASWHPPYIGSLTRPRPGQPLPQAQRECCNSFEAER